MPPVRIVLSALVTVAIAAACMARGHASQPSTPRTFQPADLFEVQRTGSVAWSPDGRYAAIEVTRRSRRLEGIPNYDLLLLDVRARKMRALTAPRSPQLGFFNATWSPDSRRLAFLSVDGEAVVRLWLWDTASAAPAEVRSTDLRVTPGDPPITWIDGNRLAMVSWASSDDKYGQLATRILRGRRAADLRARARAAGRHSATVLESRGAPAPRHPPARLEVLDVRTRNRTRLAEGCVHRVSAAADGCCITFMRHDDSMPAAAYFERAEKAGNADAGYVAVNWGTIEQTIDARTGVPAIAPPAPARAAARQVTPDPPVAGARLLSQSPAADAAIYLHHGPDDSRMWLRGGAGRPMSSTAEIWRGNEATKSIALGRPESIAYTSTEGQPLTAWLLLPPGHKEGAKAPMVTIVYPTTVYGQAIPQTFSAYSPNLLQPQLFAALGYAVLLPSMPGTKDPHDSHAIDKLAGSVMPAIDAAIARGAIDENRLAVAGHSDGGFATLAMVAQTNRFRSAIAIASFSNLVSFYGAVRGDSTHGDVMQPEMGQVMRMLQFEKGLMGLAAPPWIDPDAYLRNSPLLLADKVQTPAMLIHGELDDIPSQQAEEFFAALLRQDKRAQLVRYSGEGHEISGRENVVDMWRRIGAWLAETMPRN